MSNEDSISIPGRNDFHREGYAGPRPPPRHDAHRYFLKPYVLGVESLNLIRGATRRQVEDAMRGHIPDQPTLWDATGAAELKPLAREPWNANQAGPQAVA